MLLEDLADLGDRPVAVVGHRLDEEERPGRAGALVDDLLVRRALDLAGAALDGPLDRVVGHRLALGVGDRLAQARVAAGSPPPMRAATVSSLMSFVKSLPRFASRAPFLCLIVAHFEWPLMDGRLLVAESDGAGEERAR